MSNSMNTLHGMTLHKSTEKHTIEGKSYYNKRKKIKHKEDLKKHRDGNAGKQLCNKFCDNNNHPGLKVEFEELDLSQKKELD